MTSELKLCSCIILIKWYLLSFFGKILEFLINQVLVQKLIDTKLLSNRYYWFRQTCSTAGVLTVISGDIYHALDKVVEVRAGTVNISNAFDEVCHEDRMKINSYCITGLIKSILKKRKIQFFLNGLMSKQYDINVGVP